MTRYGARGDIGSTWVMWLCAILAGGIILTWYLQNLSPVQATTSRLDADLERLHEQCALACHSSGFESRTLIKSTGTITANETSLCMSVVVMREFETRCLPAPCAINETALRVEGPDRVLLRKQGSLLTIEAVPR